MNHRSLSSIGVVLMVSWLGFAPASAAQPSVAVAERSIVNVRNGLYLARYDWRATIFIVTPEGIVVGDPLSVDAARWLRQELATRFPAQPVRFVLHSHHHFDRASGAVVFAGATTVGHRAFNGELQSVRRSANYADVRPVTRVFDTRERVTVGGKTVEMVYTGRGHAPGMSALYFPEERVLFVVDPPAVISSPFSLEPSYSLQEVSTWVDAVSSLDVETVLLGDGNRMDAAAPKQLKPYLDDVIGSVTAAVAAGRSLSQTRTEVQLSTHVTHSHYAARATHIESVYRSLAVREWIVYGAGALNHLSANNAYCEDYASCEPLSGMPRAFTAGLMWSTGRYGFAVEGATSGQLVASRTSRFYDDSVANRRTSLSGLFRYQFSQQAALSAALVGGFSFIVSDTRGLNRVKEAEVPFGGRHDIVSRYSSPAATMGGDLAIAVTPRLVISVPVRVNIGDVGSDEFHAGRTDLRVGVGLGFRLARRVSGVPGQEAPVFVRSTGSVAGGQKP